MENEAGEWLEDLVYQASLSPGYVDSDIQPPGPQHPGEWVVVYEFVNHDALRGWLDSDARQSRIDKQPELFMSQPREQVLATRPRGQQPVTAVSSFRLRSDAKGEFDDAFARLLATVETFDGFVQCEMFPAESGLQEDAIVVFSFENRALLDRWLHSSERAAEMTRIDQLLDADRTTNVMGGFAGWFGNPADAPVRTWKQAFLVLVALYPTALAVGFLRDLLLPDLSTPVATLIGNALGVAILSWLVMPPLTRRCSEWLRR